MRRSCIDIKEFCGHGSDVEEEIKKVRMAYAQRRGDHNLEDLLESKPMDVANEWLFNRSGKQHCGVLHDLMRAGKKTYKTNGVAADISQNPAKRHRAGPLLPAMMKSSQMIVLNSDGIEGVEPPKNHILTCDDLSLIHGWPTKRAAPRYQGLLNYDLSKSDLAVQQRILGDGMSVHCVEMWYLFIFSHCARRSDLEKFDFGMPAVEPVEDDDGPETEPEPKPKFRRTSSTGSDAFDICCQEVDHGGMY